MFEEENNIYFQVLLNDKHTRLHWSERKPFQVVHNFRYTLVPKYFRQFRLGVFKRLIMTSWSSVYNRV